MFTMLQERKSLYNYSQVDIISGRGQLIPVVQTQLFYSYSFNKSTILLFLTILEWLTLFWGYAIITISKYTFVELMIG